MHYDYMHWGHRGREAFIAFQLNRFDTHMLNAPPLLVTVAGATIFAIGALGVYELIARLVSIILNAVNPIGEKH